MTLQAQPAAHGIRRYLPGLGSIADGARHSAGADSRAALTVWAVVVPQSLAYATLAGVPSVHGLYAAVAALAAYALFGTCRDLNMGAESTVALMAAAAVAPVAMNPDDVVELTALAALLVGGWCVLGFVFRLGFISEFLSRPILAGYVFGSGIQITAPMDQQPYITWLVRLGNAAQLENKTLEYCLAVSPLIWGARAPVGEWPFHVEAAVNSTGMDYAAIIKDIQADPDKYDAVWQQNQVEFQATGQGGVPTMSWNGEPFFGQDRFDQFFWRLRQNGLTKRKVPREPMVAQPLRWPSSPGGE